jgi:hypothetical protein
VTLADNCTKVWVCFAWRCCRVSNHRLDLPSGFCQLGVKIAELPRVGWLSVVVGVLPPLYSWPPASR